MIKFNDAASAKERGKTNPLSLKQEEEVIAILNKKQFTKAELKKIQKLVNHYQNLCHYAAYTQGFYVTEEKPHQLKFK